MQDQRAIALKALIESGKMQNQKQILQALHKKGIPLTQATLSRELNKMGAFKSQGAYQLGPLGYALDGTSQVTSIDFVIPNLFILKTTPGLAQCAAFHIDSANINGVAGTIAGDDTIFVAITSPKIKSQVQNTLTNIFAIASRRRH